MNLIAALCLGIGLSAACGFRVFIPPLAFSIATHAGVVQPSTEWEWLGTYPAIITLSIAAIVEVFAYFIPWVSNLLDSIEVALAPVAGTFITASSLSMAGEVDPTLMWTLSILAGGGAAETVEVATSLTRLVASGATAGMGGPVVSVMEMISSIVMSILAITLPILATFLVVFLMIFFVRRILRFLAQRKRKREIKDIGD